MDKDYDPNSLREEWAEFDATVQGEPQYRWIAQDGLAVLTRPFKEPLAYGRRSLEVAVANIRASRTSYATDAGFEADLAMFTVGLAVFPATEE